MSDIEIKAYEEDLLESLNWTRSKQNEVELNEKYIQN